MVSRVDTEKCRSTERSSAKPSPFTFSKKPPKVPFSHKIRGFGDRIFRRDPYLGALLECPRNFPLSPEVLGKSLQATSEQEGGQPDLTQTLGVEPKFDFDVYNGFKKKEESGDLMDENKKSLRQLPEGFIDTFGITRFRYFFRQYPVTSSKVSYMQYTLNGIDQSKETPPVAQEQEIDFDVYNGFKKLVK